MIWDDWQDVARIAATAFAAYFFLILTLRTFGKRSLAQLNIFDFVVTVALGSTLASIVLDSAASWVDGAVALVALIGLQWLVARLSVAWAPMRRLIRAEPRILLVDGEMCDTAMKAERITRGEVEEAVRKSGFGDLSRVGAVVLETEGSLSVISKDKLGDRSALRSLSSRDDR